MRPSFTFVCNAAIGRLVVRLAVKTSSRLERVYSFGGMIRPIKTIRIGYGLSYLNIADPSLFGSSEAMQHSRAIQCHGIVRRVEGKLIEATVRKTIPIRATDREQRLALVIMGFVILLSGRDERNTSILRSK